MRINKDQYAVIGNPIAHSKSPFIHDLYAQQTEQNMQYTALRFELDDFKKQLLAFFANGGLGANVTVPFKEDAWAACDTLSAGASLAGAVNTLSYIDGKIVGDNTDGLGLVADLINNQSFSFANKKILILGAGGAVRGVLKPIIDQQPLSITVANRTVAKAEALAQVFINHFNIDVCQFSDLVDQYDLIINGTSSSLSNQKLPLAASIVGSDTVLYDMMYAKDVTAFNDWGLSLGALKAVDGLGMLVGQAAESFYIWRGVRPQTHSVINAVRESL
jgi:shikimate dehydrogenase